MKLEKKNETTCGQQERRSEPRRQGLSETSWGADPDRPQQKGGMRINASASFTAEEQPPLVKHAPGVWQSSSSGSDAWRATPPTQMLIPNEDAASGKYDEAQSSIRPTG